VPYFTSENVFNLKSQPKSMAILGTGPIASELGQAFQRLGTEVTFISLTYMLPREDNDASEMLHKQLEKDGCKFHFFSTITKVELLKKASDVEHALLNITIKGQESIHTI
jgi:pyruvate/2-oxoglutarate dehydrogenase complex dihydrolipoamide dehydrogenase (E3) component